MSKSGKSLKKSTSGTSNLSSKQNLDTIDKEYVYDALPKISDEKWTEIMKSEEEDKAYYKIIYDMYRKSRDEEKKEYVELHVYPFIVMCCHIAWTKIINIYFQRCDPGEPQEKYDQVWKADKEPPSSPADSWSSHCIPVRPQAMNLSPSDEFGIPTSVPSHHKKKQALERKEYPERLMQDRTPQEKTEQQSHNVTTIPSAALLSEDKPDQTHSITLETKSNATVEKTRPTSGEVRKSDKYKDTIKKSKVSHQSHESRLKYFFIHQVSDNVKDVLKILFSEEEYKKLLAENVPIPMDLIDFIMDILPDFDEMKEFESEVAEHRENFEEDEFGFCFTGEEFLTEDSQREHLASTKKAKSDKRELPRTLEYQKYESNPIILDERTDVKSRVKALAEQKVLLSSNSLKREPERRGNIK